MRIRSVFVSTNWHRFAPDCRFIDCKSSISLDEVVFIISTRIPMIEWLRSEPASWTLICRPSPLVAAGRLHNQGLGDQIFLTRESDGGVHLPTA